MERTLEFYEIVNSHQQNHETVDSKSLISFHSESIKIVLSINNKS